MEEFNQRFKKAIKMRNITHNDEHISDDRNHNDDTGQYILDSYNQMDEEGKKQQLEYIGLIVPKFRKSG